MKKLLVAFIIIVAICADVYYIGVASGRWTTPAESAKVATARQAIGDLGVACTTMGRAGWAPYEIKATDAVDAVNPQDYTTLSAALWNEMAIYCGM